MIPRCAIPLQLPESLDLIPKTKIPRHDFQWMIAFAMTISLLKSAAHEHVTSKHVQVKSLSSEKMENETTAESCLMSFD